MISQDQLTGDGASDCLGESAGDLDWVRGGGGHGGASWAVGDRWVAGGDGDNIGDKGRAIPGHDGTGEETSNNGEAHLV